MFLHDWAHKKELIQQAKQGPLGNDPCFTPDDRTDMVSGKQLLKKLRRQTMTEIIVILMFLGKKCEE